MANACSHAVDGLAVSSARGYALRSVAPAGGAALPAAAHAPVGHPSTAAAGPLSAADDTAAWSAPLADWARTELARGAPDLHARAAAVLDRTLLSVALEHTGGHRGDAAARLGLGRNTLTRKLGPGRRGPPSPQGDSP